MILIDHFFICDEKKYIFFDQFEEINSLMPNMSCKIYSNLDYRLNKRNKRYHYTNSIFSCNSLGFLSSWFCSEKKIHSKLKRILSNEVGNRTDTNELFINLDVRKKNLCFLNVFKSVKFFYWRASQNMTWYWILVPEK